jgi:6-phospho-3-hexuloisomerase
MDDLIDRVLAEISTCLHLLSADSLTKAGTLMEDSSRIFVTGAGRSGLVMRALGTRLMHLGKTVYVVGDSTTPSIQTGELLVIGSGSGRTPQQIIIAQKAQSQGAAILLFTTDTSSPLAKLADLCIAVPAPSLEDTSKEHDLNSIQPMGTLFEQSLLIICDTIILRLMSRTGISVSQMRLRHANLE